MKKIFFFLIILVVLTVGCVGSQKNVAVSPDKAFYDKAYHGPGFSETIGQLNTAVIKNNITLKKESLESLIKQREAFISELEGMPVSEKMEPIKQEFILTWKYQDYQDQYDLATINEPKPTTFTQENMDVYKALTANTTLSSEKFNHAIQMYNELYPEQSTPIQTKVVSTKGYRIQVSYSGSWQGNYGDVSGQQSIDGTGDEEYSMNSPQGPIVAVIQKYDGSNDTLTVKILKDGKVMKSGHTSSPYGVVTVSYDPGMF
jgi:hypothetical protein